MSALYLDADYGSAASGGNLTINKPSTVVQGDLMIARMVAAAVATWTPPAGGWTGPIGAVAGGAMFWKIAGASEGSTFVFTNSSGLVATRGVIERWTKFDPNNPIQAAAGSSVTQNGLSPAVTATLDDSVLACALVNAGTNTSTPTVPSGMTQTFLSTTTAFRMGARLVVGPGSTGTKQWTNPNASCYATSLIINPRQVEYVGILPI